MSQAVKRRSTTTTRAGQYMCAECGKIFDTKNEVDTHIHKWHKPRMRSLLNGLEGYITE